MPTLESFSIDDVAAMLHCSRSHVVDLLGNELVATSLDTFDRASGQEVRVTADSVLRFMRRAAVDEVIAGLPHHSRR